MSPPFEAYDPRRPRRRRTREVAIGDVVIGGNRPIAVQSMTTTRPTDCEATVAQTIALVDAGCDIVRVTAPTVNDAAALAEVRRELDRRGMRVPLVADIHFLPAAAMEAALHVEKVRINPGNYADRKLFRRHTYTDQQYAAELDRVAAVFRPLVERMRDRGIALRIGSNHGSLSDRILNRYGDTPLGMVEAALEFVRICRELDYHALVLSMKASNPKVTMHAYRLLSDRMAAEGMDYPLHLGVTEAGGGEEGRLKSAVGIGALLDEGIGDTIRVSLTEDPVRELPVARELAEDCARGSGGGPTMPVDPPLPWDRHTYLRREAVETRAGPVTIGGAQPPRVEARFARGNDGSATDTVVDSIRAAAADPDEPLEIVLLRVESDADAEWAASVRERANANVGADIDGVAWILSAPVATAAEALRSWDPPPDAVEVGIAAGAPAPALPDLPVPVWAAIETGDDQDTAAVAAAAAETAAALARGRPGIEAIGIEAIAVESGWRDLAAAGRAVAAEIHRAGRPTPLRLVARDHVAGARAAARAAASLGGLLCDGIGDSIRWDAPAPVGDRVRVAYRILQGCGVRITRAEFVSCPSCGRTQFDLESTTARVQDLTRHLKGVRIAVMGCIVNGPGEMADADFGYVGASGGRINLYVGRECVDRNIAQEDGPQRLVELIRAHGRWREP